MSLYGKYIKEREGKGIVEHEHGFATYAIQHPECYIEDIYVDPEHRQSGLASRLANDVTEEAKKAGCEYLTGTVVPSANGSHTSLLALIGYGFKLHSSDKDIIYFIKRID